MTDQLTGDGKKPRLPSGYLGAEEDCTLGPREKLALQISGQNRTRHTAAPVGEDALVPCRACFWSLEGKLA